MARKVFIDEDLIQKKSWFRALPIKLKCSWFYLMLACDSIGVWDIDLNHMAFSIGEPITLKELELFNEEKRRIVFFPKKILISNYIAFQYGKLSEKCPPHKPIIKNVERLRLAYPEIFESLRLANKDSLESYMRNLCYLQEKEEEKEMDKEKESEEEKERRARKEFAESLVKS